MGSVSSFLMIKPRKVFLGHLLTDTFEEVKVYYGVKILQYLPNFIGLLQHLERWLKPIKVSTIKHNSKD